MQEPLGEHERLLAAMNEDDDLLLVDVLSPSGFSVDVFWKFWVFCRGCNFIVARSALPHHVCDLTASD